MQEKELDIDLSVHVCYSQKEKEVLQDYLSKRCSPDEAQRLWENAVFLPPFLRLGKLVKINSAGKLKLC